MASVLFGTLCAFWTFMTISFSKLGEFSFIIFSNRFPIYCSFSSPSSTSVMKMLECLNLALIYFSYMFISCKHFFRA